MNKVTMKALANDIVAGILRDLTGRGGLQETWNSIDDETQLEIKEAWNSVAYDRLEPDLKDMVRHSEMRSLSDEITRLQRQQGVIT